MREYELVEKKVREYELKSVTCNKCGKTKKITSEDYQKEWEAAEFQSFSCSFGYGSKFDMEEWNFDLCEDCLEEIVNSFKIKPEGFKR
ncbi:hypothetical protein [Neobacillus muris]|uniref:hypothetical protein n=1 Tax=Neobacillus muris TaxID=2941334 RepID=UPI00203ABE28|nr:hypothetical protein [Neobacillus muris]